MKEFMGYIKQRNAEMQAWVDEDPKNRWGGMLIEDVSHWLDIGITTIEQFEREELITEISECSKTANGRRLQTNFSEMSMEELKDLADYYSKEAELQLEREAEETQRAVEAHKSTVQEMIDIGAKDETTALRWLTMDCGFDHEQDVESYAWNWNILFTDYGKDLVNKLNAIHFGS